MKTQPNLAGKRFQINGVVQGVGFRPFIYKLAIDHQLTGWVQNNSSGVLIEVFGDSTRIAGFEQDIPIHLPPLARILTFGSLEIPFEQRSQFEIHKSQKQADAFSFISPDVAICEDCKYELLDPTDRRFRYPFINCTNCGPRFSIIQDMPYDRPATTMAGFDLCPECQAEYENPLDRRFHAQPIACPNCGPLLSYIQNGNILATHDRALLQTRQDIRNGKIVAIKGLGGFLLACDAHNQKSLLELRKRKQRSDKAFALMAFDLQTIRKYCMVADDQADILTSRQMPILILERNRSEFLPSELAPGQSTLGMMLPYTPLHILLCQPEPGYPDLLVMTSANISEEPIIYQDEEMHRLDALADSYLTHDRPIHIRMDDSVLRFSGKQPMMIRRSRGYAPEPITIPFSSPSIFAAGALLKNTFTFTRENSAFMSPFIGDLENLETFASYEHTIDHFKVAYKIQPEAFACDLHPDFLSTQYAKDQADMHQKPLIQVQHHHAHMAASLAENGWPKDKPAIGVILDGTGLGEDHAIWGGEFLVGDFSSYQRAFHLEYLPLPGGDSAIRTPAKIALAYLHHYHLDWDESLAPVPYFSNPQLELLRKQLDGNLNIIQTSSMGRLFDAISALVGIKQIVSYEGQAAIEFESLAHSSAVHSYPFEIQGSQIKLQQLFEAIIADLHQKVDRAVISEKFHQTIGLMILCVCQEIRKGSGIADVALSGGVMQNVRLFQTATTLLESDQFNVMHHQNLPPNDGCISYGQAVIAGAKLLK